MCFQFPINNLTLLNQFLDLLQSTTDLSDLVRRTPSLELFPVLGMVCFILSLIFVILNLFVPFLRFFGAFLDAVGLILFIVFATLTIVITQAGLAVDDIPGVKSSRGYVFEGSIGTLVFATALVVFTLLYFIYGPNCSPWPLKTISFAPRRNQNEYTRSSNIDELGGNNRIQLMDQTAPLGTWSKPMK